MTTDAHVSNKCIASVIVALGGSWQFGWHTSLFNAPATQLRQHLGMVGDDHTTLWGLVVALFAVGGWIGASIAPTLADSRGRRAALAFGAAMFVLTGITETAAVLIPGAHAPYTDIAAGPTSLLCLGRLASGVGAGIATVAVPMLLGEIAPVSMRGMFGSLAQFATVLGILGVVSLGYATRDSALYVVMAGSGVLGALQLVAAPFLLESPKWLLSARNDAIAAMHVLEAARGAPEDAVAAELADLKSEIAEAARVHSKQPTVRELLSSRSYAVVRWPLLAGCVLMIAQQLSGINAVFFYSGSFLKSAGVNEVAGTLAAASVNVVATGVGVLLIERAGRRPLLLAAHLGMIASALVLTGTFMWGKGSTAGDDLAIVAIAGFVSFFEIGLGTIPWLIGSEIFPDKCRATAMGFAAGINWTCQIMIAVGFPPLQEAIEGLCFVPFAAVLTVTLIFCAAFIPETRAKSQAAIAAEFAERQPTATLACCSSVTHGDTDALLA